MIQKTQLHATGDNDDLEATVLTTLVGERRIWWLNLAQGELIIHVRDLAQIEQLANDLLSQCTLWRGTPEVNQ